MGLSPTGVAGRAGDARLIARPVSVAWEKYVGIPFADRGRDWRGYDCWGLVWLVYRVELGIELPSYGDVSAAHVIRVSQAIHHDGNAEPWRAVERGDQQSFDVVMLRGAPWHVGVLTAPDLLLHLDEVTDSVIVPLEHPSVAGRIIGVRRHKAIA